MNGFLYISSSCLCNERIDDSVLDFLQFGIKNIELSGGTKFYKGIENDLIKLKVRHDVNFLIHNYFPPPEEELFLNLSSSDKAECSKTLALIARAIRLARRLGINMYSVHPGFTINLLQLFKGQPQVLEQADINKKHQAEEIFYSNLERIIKDLPDSRFRLAVENTYPLNGSPNYSLLCTPEEIQEFLRYTESRPNLGFLLDLGHLNITASLLGFDKFTFVKQLFQEYKEKVFELHISENNGVKDSHDVSGKDSWQIAVVRDLMDVLLRQAVPVVFEWRRGGLMAVKSRYKELAGEFFP